MKSVIVALSILAAAFVAATAASSRMNKYIMWRDLEVGEIEGKSNWGDGVIIVRQDGFGNSLLFKELWTWEKVYVPRDKPYISFIGKEGEIENEIPIITNNTKASDIDSNGQKLGTHNTYTNSAVPDGKGDQGVALRMDGDKAVLYRVRLLGYQDTLLDNRGTHFFYRCYIQGGVDFICGRGKSLYEECTLNSTRGGAIAAHKREENDETGFSFVGCKIKGLGPTLLGRAWGNYSRIVYSYCTMDDIIQPLGWSDWGDPSRQRTSMFGEYRCEGKGSNRSRRTQWSFSLKDEEAMTFLGRAFIKGYTWLAL
ncbi:pectinesterase QRT1-like [Senna tora]|uniref:pectinesterase n=1 Tax=Senna tora TaxID=362788 RepID=A0A834XFW0_9FABA|nr:pectinesterase QRT1-like [Senna tora]